MKTKGITIACILLLFSSAIIQAQQGNGMMETTSRNRAGDRIKTLIVARNIENVNYADEYDRSLLMYAAAHGYLQTCRILIRRGADPDMQAIDGVTAAMYASGNGHAEVVKLLLERGIDPNVQAIEGMNALMMAAQNGHAEVAEMLINSGANYNHQASDGFTSLMIASQNGHAEVVKLLLEKGARVDLQD
jgi:ankyrin repeat protein